MTRILPLAVSGVLLGLSLSTPSRGNEIIVDGLPCNSFCQDWLGVGHNPTPLAASEGAPAESLGAMKRPGPRRLILPILPPQEATAPRLVQRAAPARADEAAAPGPAESRYPPREQSARLPDLNTLVAVRGAIIVETGADRRSKQKQLADLLKATSRPDQTPQRATEDASHPSP